MNTHSSTCLQAGKITPLVHISPRNAGGGKVLPKTNQLTCHWKGTRVSEECNEAMEMNVNP